MSKGWISVHRKLKENSIWADPNYLKLWMFCLFEASHKDREQLVGNQVVKLKRGQFITGRFSLEEEMNKGVKPKQRLDKLTWWRHLNNLQKLGMLNIKTTNKYSVVTVENYEHYQDHSSSGEHKVEHQMNNKRTTDEQQMNTNNNVNNSNNENKSSRKCIYEDIHFELAERFYQNILKNNPDAKKPDLEKWANDIRLMMDKDNRTEKQITYLIDWVQQDDFEMVNVLSPSKLRKRFDQLVLKVKKQKTKPSNNQNDYSELAERLGDE